MLILNKPNHARKQLEKLTFIPQAAEKVEFLADSRAFKTRIYILKKMKRGKRFWLHFIKLNKPTLI